MNKYWMVNHKINNRLVNGDFKTYLVDLKSKCAILGINDPTTPKFTIIGEVIESLNINVFICHPNLLFLNPIENVFSKWKNVVNRGNAQNELLTLTESIFKLITSSDCDGF